MELEKLRAAARRAAKGKAEVALADDGVIIVELEGPYDPSHGVYDDAESVRKELERALGAKVRLADIKELGPMHYLVKYLIHQEPR